MKKLSILTLVTLLLIGYDSFAQSTEFVLRKSAKRLSKSCFTVTLDKGNEAGAIWWPNQVDLSKELELNFLIYMGDKDSGGADGLAFVFHNDPRGFEAKGEVGAGLYAGEHPSQGANTWITPSVIIEMDTYKNGGCDANNIGGINDPDADHTTVVYNGDICHPKFNPIRLHPTKDNVEDNSCYPAVIKWKPGTGGQPDELSLYVDGQFRFTHKDYMLKNVFNNNKMVSYGFTGSTGGSTNEQTICIFDGNSTPVAKNDDAKTPYGTPVTVDVQANDKDSDGDPLFTTQILVAPKHGIAEILNDNKIKFSPFNGYAGLDSLLYRVCDIKPDAKGEKCYANCSNAWVYFNRVECPVYTLRSEIKKDNEKCDNSKPNNGIARAYMWDGTKEVTDFIVFRWYKGNLAAADTAGKPHVKGTLVSNLSEGDWTIAANLTLSNACPFNLEHINIKRLEVKPDFKLVITNASKCSPSDGALEVKFTDPNINTSNYTYTWYEVFPNVIATGSTKLSNLQPKNYTVKVTNKLSGCEQLKSETVGNPTNVAVINPVLTDRTSCATPNGEIKVTVNGSTSTHDIYLSKGNDPKMLTAVKGSTFTGLEVGFYYVTAVHKITLCPTDTLKLLEVKDKRSNPVINGFNKIDLTSCKVSDPNGTITITDVDGKPLTDYDFSWFNGNNTLTVNALPSTQIDATNANKAIKLPAGDYTVKVINKTTQCFVTKSFTIEDKIVTPNIHLIALQDQTNCTPANGSISIDVDIDGVGAGTTYTTTGYTFKWWKNGVLNANTASSWTGLLAGTYKVEATSASGCVAVRTFTIKLTATDPIVSVAVTNHQTSCDTDPAKLRGKLTATVISPGTYSYQWYKGDGTTTVMTGYTALVADKLNAGVYTIKVTNTVTGCFSTAKGEVISTPSTLPVVSVNPAAIQEQTLCSDPNPGPGQNKPNGSAEASATAGNVSNIRFRWFNGEFTASQLNGKTPNFRGTKYQYLAAGKYTVLAVDTVDNCVSSPFVVTIPSNIPAITINPNTFGITSTNCFSPDGGLEANPTVGGGGPAHTFRFFWYKGSPEFNTAPYFSSTTPKIAPDLAYKADSSAISNLTPSRYTVVVKDLTTGCWAFETKDLLAVSPIPTVSLTPTNNSDCINKNGVITIDFIYKDKANTPSDQVPSADILTFYTISLYKENVLIASNKLVFDKLAPGKYVVVAKEKTGNFCDSYPETVEIEDVPKMEPIINFIASASRTYCDPLTPNGELKVTLTNPQTAGNFSHYTYELNGGTAVAFTGVTMTLTGLDIGSHSIKVTNTNTHCTTTATASINDLRKDPVGNFDIVSHQTLCPKPKGNGELAVITPNTTLYEYRWYKISDGTEIGIKDGNQVSINELEAGDYSLKITDRTTKCFLLVEKTILDHTVVPVVSLESTTHQTICVGGYDGTATISLNPGTNYSTDYQSFAWKFNGTLMGTPPTLSSVDKNGVALQSNEFRAINLQEGVYELTVATNSSPNCTAVETFTIDKVPVLPTLSAIGIDQTICGALNNATITASSIKPIGLTNFVWKKVENNVALTPALATTTNTLTSVEPGEYAVTVIDTKGCESLPFQLEIFDKTPTITIVLDTLIHNSNCNVSANGMIRIKDEVGYTYQWTSTNTIKPTEVDKVQITGLSAGKYTVTKSKNNCSHSEEYEIIDKPFTFLPRVSKSDVTRCIAPYDGILVATMDGSAQYNFNWKKDGEPNGIDMGYLENLNFGNYTLTVTHTATGCQYIEQVTLDFIDSDFIIDVNEDKPVSNCEWETRPNGQVSVSAGGEVSGYTFDWYETDNVIPNVTPIAFSGSTISELKPVDYTVIVTNDITGCSKNTPIRPTFVPASVGIAEVDSVRGVTSCIDPNGYATVSVNGSNANHIFHWYQGSDKKFEGYKQTTLEIGEYQVIAIDRLSGCPSEPITVQIPDIRIYVDFNVSTTNSLCNNNTGTASITWIEPVGVSTIHLNNGTESYYSDAPFELPYGEFEITVETVEGCVTKKTVSIGIDYIVFNGVSPNGDANNDYLAIDCIEKFPGNTVKIFNRAGALVYVGDGYDNESVRFEGLGNKGIYTTGNHLPDGTYYYVIDAGDGRKQKAGFFELLR